MREILFRGKRVENGKWVDGDLVKRDKSFYVLQSDSDDYECNEVIPETVGQYTGLDDKNDVKVFEGDIVNCSRGCPHEVYFTTEHGGFLGGMPALYLKGLREGYTWMGVEEVIGNIHDKEV